MMKEPTYTSSKFRFLIRFQTCGTNLECSFIALYTTFLVRSLGSLKWRFQLALVNSCRKGEAISTCHLTGIHFKRPNQYHFQGKNNSLKCNSLFELICLLIGERESENNFEDKVAVPFQKRYSLYPFMTEPCSRLEIINYCIFMRRLCIFVRDSNSVVRWSWKFKVTNTLMGKISRFDGCPGWLNTIDI